MADDVLVGNTPGSADYTVATDDVAGKHFQRVKLDIGGDGATSPVITGNGLPVTGPLTDTQLRATPVPVSGTVTASGPLTDAQLRATAVPVSQAHPALTASAPGFATVGIASGAAVATNANRKGLVLVNVSGAWVYLAFGATAVLGSGIALGPWGGSWTMGKDTFTTAAVNAIASAAASNVGVQEFA